MTKRKKKKTEAGETPKGAARYRHWTKRWGGQPAFVKKKSRKVEKSSTKKKQKKGEERGEMYDSSKKFNTLRACPSQLSARRIKTLPYGGRRREVEKRGKRAKRNWCKSH